MEEGLQRLWHKNSAALGVFELAPLRRADVALAAATRGLDTGAFFRALVEKNAVALAIKPVTLKLLLRRFGRNGGLPSTQAELYRDGCLSLCEENNRNYQLATRTRQTYRLDARQRLAVAGRIAAVTIFANRYAVWTGVENDDIPDEDVVVAALVGGRESVAGEVFPVDEGAIRETLRTGLFSARGPERLGWAHQTYAEFLAAEYVTSRGLPQTQVLSLLLDPGDERRKIVPQLQEAAAWVAGMNLDVLRALIATNPDVLLRSDIATAGADDRARITEALLQLGDEGNLLLSNIGRHRMYGKLAHPDLAGQLGPYIVDSAKGEVARREAIYIAEACRVSDLRDDLARVVLDRAQPRTVQVCARYALVDFGDSHARAALRPLALGEAGDDPDDELKGVGLLATWPEHLSADELFTVVTSPRRSSLLGAYAHFLSHELIARLADRDLPIALAWVTRAQTRRALPRQLAEVADAIMLRAWTNLDAPGVFAPFVAIVSYLTTRPSTIAMAPDGTTPFGDRLRVDEAARHRLVAALVPAFPDAARDWAGLLHSPTPLLFNSDILWLIERLAETTSPEAQVPWARAIGRLIDEKDARQVDTLLTVCEEYPTLAAELSWRIKPIDIDSELAETLREDYARLQQRGARDMPPPYPIAQLRECVDGFETGEPAGRWARWWNVLVQLTLDTTSGNYGQLFDADLTATPGWEATDPILRGRIIAAAQRYVAEQAPQPDDWLEGDEVSHADIAAYKALALLHREKSDALASLSDDTWQGWTPIILAYPTDSSSTDEQVQQVLAREAFCRTPTDFVATLNRLIDKENTGRGTIFITRKLALCWQDGLAAAMLAKAADPTLTPQAMGDLLDEALKWRAAGAEEFSAQFLTRPVPIEAAGRERALIAARLLLIHTPCGAWPLIRSTIQEDAEFGRALFERIAHSAAWGVVALDEFSEDELADIFLWLTRQYPPVEDPDIDGFHAVEPRESVGQWRDRALSHLKGRGTERAVAVMRQLADELPELPWLRWSLLDAQDIARRRSWEPPAPSAIVALAADRERRFVQDGAELLAVLVESLGRLQAKLQGETPAAIDIWNEWRGSGGPSYRPKAEEQFSDYVKRHFDEDLVRRGIIVNREVEIRRRTGGNPGEETDIQVDAIRQREPNDGPLDVVTAIVEAKGNWHAELWTAMESQLVGRYLEDNQVRHGLYLIGWFTCPQWDDTDHRRRSAPSVSIDEAHARLTAQAKTLSRDGQDITAVVLDTRLR